MHVRGSSILIDQLGHPETWSQLAPKTASLQSALIIFIREWMVMVRSAVQQTVIMEAVQDKE